MQRHARLSTVLTLIAAGAYAAAASAAGTPPAPPGAASPAFGPPAQAGTQALPGGGASASDLNAQWKLETERQKERADKRKQRRGGDGGSESWTSPAGSDDALQKNKPAFP